MKLRTSLVAALLVVAPAVVPAVGPLSPSVAHAQDNVTDLARERFKEGVAAYEAGKFEQARALFLQAYALKRHPAVLLNLGQSELKAGYIEDAGNHLQQFLREHKEASDAQKQAAQQGIEEAKKRTGQVIIIVDADGAQIAVDGTAVGTAPLLDPYFVAPGEHEASATSQGKSTTSKFQAKRAGTAAVNLTLGIAGTPAPVPVPSPTPTPGPVSAPVPPPYPTPYPTPVGPTGPTGPTGPDTGPDSGRENFFHWYKRKPIAWVGTGVAGVGLILTIAFGAAAASASSSADSVSQQILQQVERADDLPPNYYANGDGTGQPQPCGNFEDPGSAHPNYTDACNVLRDNIDAYDADIIGLGVSAAIGGAALIGTVVYYFVDTSGKPDPEASAVNVQVIPLLSPQHNGVGVLGTF